MDAEKFSEYFDNAPVFYGKLQVILGELYLLNESYQFLAGDTLSIFIIRRNLKRITSMPQLLLYFKFTQHNQKGISWSSSL